MSLNPSPVTDLRQEVKLGNALTAHAQTSLSCFKHTTLDRLQVCLNVVLFLIKLTFTDSAKIEYDYVLSPVGVLVIVLMTGPSYSPPINSIKAVSQ